MHLSKLIRIASVHTECALTAIQIQCTSTQSISIGGLKPYSIIILLTCDVLAGIICICTIDFHEHINENGVIKQWLVAGVLKRHDY